MGWKMKEVKSNTENGNEGKKTTTRHFSFKAKKQKQKKREEKQEEKKLIRL